MIELILEIKDKDTIKAIEALNEVGVAAIIRKDEEATWIGDSLLQALFELSEMPDEMDEELRKDVPKMVSELDWLLYEGGSARLNLIDGLRKEFFAGYVRDRVVENAEQNGVISIFKRMGRKWIRNTSRGE